MILIIVRHHGCVISKCMRVLAFPYKKYQTKQMLPNTHSNYYYAVRAWFVSHKHPGDVPLKTPLLQLCTGHQNRTKFTYFITKKKNPLHSLTLIYCSTPFKGSRKVSKLDFYFVKKLLKKQAPFWNSVFLWCSSHIRHFVFKLSSKCTKSVKFDIFNTSLSLLKSW